LIVIVWFEVWHAETPVAMPNFIKKPVVFLVFLQAQRFAHGRV